MRLLNMLPIFGLNVPDLLTSDRCDRCPGQAMVRVIMPSNRLLDFCRHHFSEHQAALLVQGAVVVQTIGEN